jgi:hypothetical protein
MMVLIVQLPPFYYYFIPLWSIYSPLDPVSKNVNRMLERDGTVYLKELQLYPSVIKVNRRKVHRYCHLSYKIPMISLRVLRKRCGQVSSLYPVRKQPAVIPSTKCKYYSRTQKAHANYHLCFYCEQYIGHHCTILNIRFA